MALATFPSTATVEEVNAVIERDGGAIISDYVSSEILESIRGDILPALDNGTWGVGMLGNRTRRLGCLFQYSSQVSHLVEQQHFLGAAEHFLRRPNLVWMGDKQYESKPDFRISLTQAIDIHPGQGGQSLHRDDLTLVNPHPGDQVRVQLMFALTDFTAENGGTMVIPGSHNWEIDRGPRPEDAISTEMKAGSALIWLGGVYHGGGVNNTEFERRAGVTIGLDQGHIAPEENHFLVYNRETVEALPFQTRQLLGYEGKLSSWGYVTVDGQLAPVRTLLDSDPSTPALTIPV